MDPAVHATLVAMLRRHPAWLGALLRVLARVSLPARATVADALRRAPYAVEAHGDLLLVEGDRGPWVMVEVLLARDDARARRWPAIAARLRDERGAMGDVVVITAQRDVAAWAAAVGHARGALGTRLGLAPVVLLLDGAHAAPFLDPRRPELCFLAAWAVHADAGPEARRVVAQCWTLIDSIPQATLRAELTRAVYGVLSPALAREHAARIAAPREVPEGASLRELRGALEARAEAPAMARALATVLTARGLAVDAATRARVGACADATQLERWIQRAATATSLAAVFAAE